MLMTPPPAIAKPGASHVCSPKTTRAGPGSDRERAMGAREWTIAVRTPTNRNCCTELNVSRTSYILRGPSGNSGTLVTAVRARQGGDNIHGISGTANHCQGVVAAHPVPDRLLLRRVSGPRQRRVRGV